LSHEVSSEHESQSGDFEESKSGSDTATRLNVASAVALAGVTYDFGQLTMTKSCLASLGSNGHYFPKGCGRPLGRNLCLSLSQTKLSCLRISLLLGSHAPTPISFRHFE
jgi:hypothetical protein